MHYTVDEQPVSQSSSLLANPTSPREHTQHASTAAVGRWLGERRTPPPASPSRNPARCAQTRGFTESIFSSRYRGGLLRKRDTEMVRVCYVFPLDIQRALSSPHHKIKSMKNVRKKVWGRIQTLASPISHMPARSLFGRCLQHIARRRLLVKSHGHRKQGKLSGTHLPILVLFWSKSNKSHTSAHRPLLTYLS